MRTKTSFKKGHKPYTQSGERNGRYYHGMRTTRQYGIWLTMKGRCDRKSSINYRNYGGKGITYDPSWKDFLTFWNDMKDGYADNLTLDRIDGTKGYYKENCRWITQAEQTLNKENNVLITFNGRTQTMSQWNAELGFKRGVLRQRLQTYGWPIEKALTKPLRNKHK